MANVKISAMFAAQKKALGDANPDTGIGGLGEWPTEGEHDCYVLGLEVNEKASYRFNTDQGQQMELPAAEFRFRYQLLNDQVNPDNPLVWGGAPFTFPENAEAVTAEGRRTGLQIERNRYCIFMCQEIASTNHEIWFKRDEGLDICNLFGPCRS